MINLLWKNSDKNYKNSSTNTGKGRKKPKIYEITKSEHKLSFEIVIGYKTSLNESYVRFISKKLREEFDLYGLSISIYVKKLKKMLKK